MKSVITTSMRLTCLLFLIASPATLTAHAQNVKLQLNSLDRLEARASESVDVTLDGAILEIAIKFLKDSDPEEKAIKEMISGLKGVYVKVFEFEKEGEYSAADLDAIRAQLRAPGWSRMVGIKSKKESENVEVYMMTTTGSQIGGLTVITTEPKEFAVINIAGSIDIEKLVQLGGKLGIPSIKITHDKKAPKE
ncbi:MAG TPA: DUF4252 domain-containing protein [Pyrinomonadaceae bacterium]